MDVITKPFLIRTAARHLRHKDHQSPLRIIDFAGIAAMWFGLCTVFSFVDMKFIGI